MKPAGRVGSILVALALLLMACGGDDDVGFTANRGPISQDLVGALGDGGDAQQVPAVQRNFLEGCVKGGRETLPDLPQVQIDGLLAVCGCSYDALVSFFEGQASGDSESARERDAVARFEEIEVDLSAPDSRIDPAITELVATCIRTEAGF